MITNQLFVVGDCTISAVRAGLLYRYVISKQGRVVRYGCAFTLWGVRYAARRA
jgi:hypothetical protein